MMRIRAHAKLNLYLRVTGRRADGYHELCSLFALCDLADELSIEPAKTLTCTVQGTFAGEAGEGEGNLVLRAARALQARTGQCGGAAVTLTKNIPVAAGLGGGSADAAATLLALNRLWSLGLAEADLAAIGAGLGADIPAALAGRAALVSSIGEIIEAAPTLPEAHILLVHPGEPAATPAVFRAFAGLRSETRFSAPMPLRHTPPDLNAFAHELALRGNDLTRAAISVAPAVDEVLALLSALPQARYAAMSGSGSACFALFANAAEAERAKREISALRPNWWCWAGAMLSGAGRQSA